MFKRVETFFETLIFTSRWMQAPLYFGLIVGSLLYGVQFFQQLNEMWYHVFEPTHEQGEDALMLDLLTMVDMTMVFNLVVIVTIGGYATFVSKLNISDHEDRPEWLKHITASTLKIKLTSSLVGISGVHLLKTFLNIDRVEHLESEKIAWQMAVHGMFLASTVILSAADWILYGRTSHVDH
ncbi:MAG TPA: TIGR00645 family protein [Pirellulales bacterium]